MKLQCIEHFIEVVTAGSIRGAARRLGMSQPALTRSLQQLEKDLGVQLMDRGVRGASLTQAGQTFLTRARVAQAELAKAAEEARLVVGDLSSLVTLGVSPVAASLLLPELVTSLHSHHPKARVRILEVAPSTLLAMVREGTAELAVTQRTRANLDSSLKYAPLFDIQLGIVARKGHPLAGTRELRELADAAWAAPTAPGISDDIITQSFQAMGMQAPAPSLHCSSYHYGLEMVVASDMLLPVPPPMMRECTASGRFIEIPLTRPLKPLHVGMYTAADSLPLMVTKSAIRIITGIARRYAASGELRRVSADQSLRASGK